jgi:TonB family protein
VIDECAQDAFAPVLWRAFALGMNAVRLSVFAGLGLMLAVAPAGAMPGDGPPKLLNSVTPEYPAALKAQRIVGWAEILCLVDEQGAVGDVTVEHTTLDEFGRAAAAAVRQFQYQPAIKGGRPYAVHVRIPVNFNLGDDDLAEQESHRAKEALADGPPIMEISAIDEWPELEQEIRPVTPASLVKQRAMGQAMVGFVVDEHGLPRDVHLVFTTHSECAEPAVAAVRRWKFAPGKKDGRVVRVNLQVPMVFFPETFRANGPRVRPGVRDRIELDGTGDFASGGKRELPRPTKMVHIEYPGEMRSRGQAGVVKVEAIINSRGVVTHVHAVDAANLYFAVLTERALSHTTFFPAKIGGMPVPCHVIIPVTFQLMY